MNFLHFGLLPYFLPLAAIPILLHLLTLHRLKTVELSTFRFLFDSYVQQRRRMKFLEALIAFLRTLFLLLLILAIARPAVKHWSQLFGGSESGRDVVLLIDSSASMHAVTDGVTALERAKQAALAVVDRLGMDDRVTVIRVGAKPTEVCNRFSSDVTSIRSEIESLRATPSRSNIFAAMSYVFSGGTRELRKPRVYLFSDMQASGWDEFVEGETESLIPDEAELVVVHVGSNQELPNVAVVGDAPEEQRALAGLPIKLTPRVTNHSETETRDVPVAIFIDDQEIGRQTLTLEPGETKATEIIYTPLAAGSLRGRFEIPADRFEHDDNFLFTLHVAPRIRVVLVNGNPAVQPLENEGLYLRTALLATEPEVEVVSSAETPADTKLQEERLLVHSLVVDDIPQNELKEETLLDADVVMLANCGGLNEKQCAGLRQYVADGGGLLILPGDKVNHDAYNKQLFPSPEVPDQAFVAATFDPPSGDAEKGDLLRHFAAIDFAHPIFAVFADGEQRYLTKVNVARCFPIQLPEPRGNSWPLVTFDDGKPALLESTFGNGRVLVTAFPLNTRWSNLPMKPEFVPLVLRMIGYVRRPAEVAGPSVVAADGSAEFQVAQHWAPASGKVTNAAGQTTPVSFQRSNSRLVGAYEQTDSKGYYTLEVHGGNVEQPRGEMLSFAVNLAPAESNFVPLTAPQIEKLLPTAQVTSVDASAEAQQLHGGIGDEREVWRPLILLTFLVIGVEFLLATLGGQSLDNEQRRTTMQRLRDLARGNWVGQMTGSGFRELTGSRED